MQIELIACLRRFFAIQENKYKEKMNNFFVVATHVTVPSKF